MRPNSSSQPARAGDLAHLPKKQLSRKITRPHKGQKVAPSLQVTDAGMAARARFYAQSNQDYRDINHSWTVVWLRHRLKEYVNVHGFASCGVCALLERAAEQYADGDYLRAKAAASGGKDIAERLHQAARHAQLARSHELAAWELAAREGIANKALEGNMAGMSNRNGKLQAIIQEHPAAESGDPLPPFRPPGGVEGRGPLFSPWPSETELPKPKGGRPRKSPSLPLDAPASYIAQPKPPKAPIYQYCEGCARNYREKVCPRCPPQSPAGSGDLAAPGESVTLAEEDVP